MATSRSSFSFSVPRFSHSSFSRSVFLREGTQSQGQRRRRGWNWRRRRRRSRRRCSDIHEGCDRARWYDNWKRRRRREARMERTGSLMRNRGSGVPSEGRGGTGGGGGRRGRGRWLPWLPETAVAATDDARGVTDSWQSYRAPTRTDCVSTYAALTQTHTYVKHT